MSFNKEVGNRLKELRKGRHYSQESIITELQDRFPDSDLPGTKGGWYSYETGRTKPSLEGIGQLASFFGVSTDYLLGLSEEMNPNAKGFAQATGISESAMANISKYKDNKAIMECINQLLSSYEFVSAMEKITAAKIYTPMKDDKADVIDSVRNGAGIFNILTGNQNRSDTQVILSGEKLKEWLLWQSMQAISNIVDRIVKGDKGNGTH